MSVFVTFEKGRYKIPGRAGRYEGLTIWQTKQCETCSDFRTATCLERDVFGVCTKGEAWKIIMENPETRRIRKCSVNRVNRKGLT